MTLDDRPAGSAGVPPAPAGMSHAAETAALPAVGAPGNAPVAYVEQRSADLTYHLFESQAPRGAVCVLAERELALAGGRIALAIIGSSHFLEVRAGDTVLCELLACPRPGLEAAPTKVQLGDRRALAHRLRRDGLTYRFDLWRQRCSGPELEGESARLSSPGPNRLQFVFPAGESPRGAITCLEWQVEGRQVSIATQHTYPGESSIVHTRSVIDIAETGATS